MDEIRFRRSNQRLYVDDVEVKSNDEFAWTAPKSLVAGVSLASLRRTMLNLADYWDLYGVNDPEGPDDLTGTLYVSEIDGEDFDAEYSPVLETSLGVLGNGTSILIVQVEIHGLELEEEDYAGLLAPLLTRVKAEHVSTTLHASGNQGLVVLHFAYGPRGATVADALEVGESIAAFVTQVRRGALDVEAVLHLVRAGRSELLIGLRESRWLEVKSQGYDLSGDAGKIELAQDVSRFANGAVDAVLVIGFRASKSGPSGDEVIKALTASLTPFPVQQYHQVIDARVFPPILGLDVEAHLVALRGGRVGHVLTVRVPAQAEESKPFLVHGAIVGGRVEGAFISIVQRRGEHSIPISGPSIHSTLAAGRALLRRGVVDPPAK